MRYGQFCVTTTLFKATMFVYLILAVGLTLTSICFIRCSICEAIVGRPHGSTSKMRGHLSSQHPDKPLSTPPSKSGRHNTAHQKGKDIGILHPSVFMHQGFNEVVQQCLQLVRSFLQLLGCLCVCILYHP